jgi:hypothetical protein
MPATSPSDPFKSNRTPAVVDQSRYCAVSQSLVAMAIPLTRIDPLMLR